VNSATVARAWLFR